MEPLEYLKQNASDMKTTVETYLVEEVSELIYDGEKLDRWNDLVAQLGLTGQRSVVKPEKSPIPFLIMNEQIKAVFETLCPNKVDVSEYNQMPIPVEILDLISLSVKEEYFGEIQIWYDEKQKDPVCVGKEASWCVDDSQGHKVSACGSFSTKSACDNYIKENNL